LSPTLEDAILEEPVSVAAGLVGEGAKSVGPPRAMEAEVGAAKEFRTRPLAAGALLNRLVVAMLFLDLGMMDFGCLVNSRNQDRKKVCRSTREETVEKNILS